MPIRLVTLGGLRGAHNGKSLHWLDSQWLRAALLVHIAIERTCSRDALLAMFWPESDAESAGHRLNQTIYALRRALGDDCIETKGRDLRAGPQLEADLLEFDQAVREQRWAEAVAAYAGPFLAGVHLAETNAFQSWVDVRRHACARSFRKACRAALDAQVAAQDWTAAIGTAQAWVTPDPLDDEAQHRLIELLARTGSRIQALKQYESYVRLLDADGLKPLDETSDLARLIGQQTTATDRKPIPSLNTGAAPEPAADQLSVAAAGKPSRKFLSVAVVALMVALATSVDSPNEASTELIPAAPESIAVLVFDGRSDLDWLASGVTRSLIDALEKVSGLSVRPYHAVLPYREGRTPPDSVARMLGVKWLVAGSVDSVGKQLVVRAELVDGAAADLVAARDVKRAAGQELQLIEQVVDRVSDQLEHFLRVSMGQEIRTRRWRTETRSVTAFQLVEHALALVEQKNAQVAAGEFLRAWDLLRRADATLEKAARADPQWPVPAIERAWVAEDIAFLTFGIRADNDSVAAALARGLAHADHALELLPGSSHALEVRGVLQHAYALMAAADSAQATRLIAAAESDLEAAASDDPTRARALSRLSSLKLARGELDNAAILAEQAWSANAYLEDARELLIRLFTISFETGNDDKASFWCRLIGQRYVNQWEAASCQLQLMAWSTSQPADPGEAWRIVESALPQTPPAFRATHSANLHTLVAAVLARSGRPDSARSLLHRTRSRAVADGLNLTSSSQAALLQNEAAVRVLLGQIDDACRLLAQYRRRTAGDIALLASSRRFAAIRSLCLQQPRSAQPS